MNVSVALNEIPEAGPGKKVMFTSIALLVGMYPPTSPKYPGRIYLTDFSEIAPHIDPCPDQIAVRKLGYEFDVKKVLRCYIFQDVLDRFFSGVDPLLGDDDIPVNPPMDTKYSLNSLLEVADKARIVGFKGQVTVVRNSTTETVRISSMWYVDDLYSLGAHDLFLYSAFIGRMRRDCLKLYQLEKVRLDRLLNSEEKISWRPKAVENGLGSDKTRDMKMMYSSSPCSLSREDSLFISKRSRTSNDSFTDERSSTKALPVSAGAYSSNPTVAELANRFSGLNDVVTDEMFLVTAKVVEVLPLDMEVVYKTSPSGSLFIHPLNLRIADQVLLSISQEQYIDITIGIDWILRFFQYPDLEKLYIDWVSVKNKLETIVTNRQPIKFRLRRKHVLVAPDVTQPAWHAMDLTINDLV